MIFSQLKICDQISLGLTCKTLGHVLEATDLNFSHTPLPISTYLEKESILYQLRDWMPQTHKLCMRGLKYVQMDGKRWKKEPHRTVRPLSGRLSTRGRHLVNLRLDMLCPNCYEK
jgi:hypothetical protein